MQVSTEKDNGLAEKIRLEKITADAVEDEKILEEQ